MPPLDVVPQELALDAVDLRQAPLVAILAGELRRQVGADDVARPAPARSRARRGRGCCSRRARRTGAPCRCRGRRPRGCSGTCRPRPPRPRRSRRRAPRGRRRRCARPRRPAAPCPGSRPDRSTRCRGRSTSWPAPATVSSTIAFSGNPAWSNAHAIFTMRLPGDRALQVLTRTPRRTPGRRSAPRPARPRAGRGARSGSSCSGPGPGTTWRNAASRAGSSSRSPARETPPPITTSSGSNVLIALAIPIPIRSPSTRRHHSDGVVAGLGARRPRRGRRSSPFCARMLAEVGVAVLDRGVVGQPVQRPPRGQRLQRAALRERVARHVVAVLRSRPMIVWPTSAADVVAPRYRRPLSTQPPPTPVPIVNMTRRRDRDPAVLERLGQRRAARVVLDVDRHAHALGQQLAQRDVVQRDVDAGEDLAGGELDDRRHADPDRARRRASSSPRSPTAICSTSASCEAWLVATIRDSESSPPSSTATAILVPPTSTPMN